MRLWNMGEEKPEGGGHCDLDMTDRGPCCGQDMPTPHLSFSQPALSLEQVLEKYSLPRVVSCDLDSFADLQGYLDWSQPLVLYKTRSVRQVTVQNVLWDDVTKLYSIVGRDLLVPEDYTGYFSVAGNPSSEPMATPVPYFTIAEAMSSDHTSFLVGGVKPLQAYLMVRQHHQARLVPHRVLSGEVLTLASHHVFENIGTPGTRCFMFQDQRDTSLLLTDDTPCLLYAISHDDQTTDDTVMTFGDILKRFSLPVVVYLVQGWLPATLGQFTGMFLLQDSSHVTTVTGTMVRGGHSISLDIPLGTDVKFRVADHTLEVTSSKFWRNALLHCRSRGATYSSSIKVIELPGDISEEDTTTFDVVNDGREDMMEVMHDLNLSDNLQQNGHVTLRSKFNRSGGQSCSLISSSQSRRLLISVADRSFCILVAPSGGTAADDSTGRRQVDTSKHTVAPHSKPQPSDSGHGESGSSQTARGTPVTGLQDGGRDVSNEGVSRLKGFREGVMERVHVVSGEVPGVHVSSGEVPGVRVSISTPSSAESQPLWSSTSNIASMDEDTDSIHIPAVPGRPTSQVSRHSGPLGEGGSHTVESTAAGNSDSRPAGSHDKKIRTLTPSVRRRGVHVDDTYPYDSLARQSDPHVYDRYQVDGDYVTARDSIYSQVLILRNQNLVISDVDETLLPPCFYNRSCHYSNSTLTHDRNNFLEYSNSFSEPLDVYQELPELDDGQTHESADSGVSSVKSDHSEDDIRQNRHSDYFAEGETKPSSHDSGPDPRPENKRSVRPPLPPRTRIAGRRAMVADKRTPQVYTRTPPVESRTPQVYTRIPPKDTRIPPKDTRTPLADSTTSPADMSNIFSPMRVIGQTRREDEASRLRRCNRDALIEELKKAMPIEANTQLAFQSLSAAEIVTLLSCEDNLDSELTKFLPKLGQLDLRKVALCLRSMRTRLSLFVVE
ncbi:uncharacterized protein LOC131957833 [Physella acuta]|uniref:uncharacterized protein LOC131957833 n=1 Tax=Physella acuta TaxID=109671 RepID=UPI0027DBFFB7|nr:uncharacterized protein LOC131957833 [Physella acuta]XP_059178630.1 uncharacterized protein LOC131957833 [Physella acuta]XP_059178637.1 uncharacterized protein LOC131957833 [Physella acuta]